MKITVKPLQGIFWENNSILLGEKIESVRRTFINTNIRTEFYNSNPSFFLFDNDLRVRFLYKGIIIKHNENRANLH